MSIVKRLSVYTIIFAGQYVMQPKLVYGRYHGRQTEGVWKPFPEFKVPGSFLVKRPSDTYQSYRNHYFTMKYAKLLALHRPDLYCKLQGIDDVFIFRVSLIREKNGLGVDRS